MNKIKQFFKQQQKINEVNNEKIKQFFNEKDEKWKALELKNYFDNNAFACQRLNEFIIEQVLEQMLKVKELEDKVKALEGKEDEKNK